MGLRDAPCAGCGCGRDPSWGFLLTGSRPAVDLEDEGAEHRDCCHEEADRRVAGKLADLPPTAGVEQDAAQRVATEDGLDLAGEGRVGRIRLRGGAQLRIGLSTTDLTEMDVDEIVRVDLSLLTGEEF